MTITFAKLGQYGRLGNCLWQAAATIAHALRNNDIFVFPKWDKMQRFNIPLSSYSNNFPILRTFEEKAFHYTPIPYLGNMNLMGYFQSQKYWEDKEDVIKKYLSPKLINSRINKTALHVRRTDYLTHNGCYHILDRHNYYDAALEQINAEEVLIFSDDIKWCKQNFVGNMFEFSDDTDEVSDLAKMISCDNVIMANSSFSWWGAYLNTNKAKQIVAPQKWFGPRLSTHDTKDLIPNQWILI